MKSNIVIAENIAAAPQTIMLFLWYIKFFTWKYPHLCMLFVDWISWPTWMDLIKSFFSYTLHIGWKTLRNYYCEIRHRDCRKYCSSPTNNQAVSLINKIFHTKISTSVHAFCWSNFMSNLNGFNKVIFFCIICILVEKCC